MSFTRAESVRRLRYIKPATSFRSGYAYDNVLYMVAGQLIEAVTGQSWEDFVREHLFKPAGMDESTTDEPDFFATTNRAQPHARMDGGFRGIGTQEVGLALLDLGGDGDLEATELVSQDPSSSAARARRVISASPDCDGTLVVCHDEPELSAAA